MDKHAEWRDDQVAKNFQKLLMKVGQEIKVRIRGKEHQRTLWDDGFKLYIVFYGKRIPVKVDEHGQVIAKYYETIGR